MRALISFLFLLTLSGCVTGLASSKDRAYKKGAESARAEIKKGVLAYESFGLQSPCSAEFDGQLKDKYGIETRVVAGCMVDTYIINHAKGFNTVMDEEIKKRFGPTTIDELYEKIRKDYEDRKAREDSIHPMERRLRNAIERVLTDEEKKQITINILGPDKFNLEGPDEIKRKVISELSGKNDLPTETK